MKIDVEYSNDAQRADLIATNTGLGYRLEKDSAVGFGVDKKMILTFTDEPYVDSNPERDAENALRSAIIGATNLQELKDALLGTVTGVSVKPKRK